MLKHSNQIALSVGTAAGKESFFNGALNTLELEFDPLIQGYAFFKWTVLPTWMQTAFPNFGPITEKNFRSFSGISDIELETSAISHGFNSNEYNYATGTKKNNTEFSIKHQEFSGSPIRNMYQYWITGIRDPETGIATYPRVYGIEYSAKNHTGEIIYIATRPDANNVDMHNIEFACYYTAVMPTKILLGHFNYDPGSHDGVEYEQSFKGVFHMSEKVDEFAKDVLAAKTYGILELGQFDPTNPSNASSNLSVLDETYNTTSAVGGSEVESTRGNIEGVDGVSAAHIANS
jgi:hypothetical protein